MVLRTALVALLATLSFPVVSHASTIEDFETAATAQKFLDLGCVLYDRLDRQRDCADLAGAELIRRSYPTSDLEALTKHPDPRVRALALVCLFEKGDPKLLPVIFALAGDTEPAFPARTPVAYVPSRSRERPFSEIPQTPQTVGTIAEGLTSFYLRKAGYFYGTRGASCPGFVDYWASRKDRDHVASWFAVQLDRATQGTTPIPQGREGAFSALRSRLDALQGEDRLWYSLFVGASEGGDHVFTEAELVAIAKTLGPDRLLLMLANRAPSSDPDLVPRPWPSTCGHTEIGEEMRYFVLDRAAALLRPDDASVLLESPKAGTAHWAIAAAALRPDLAAGILTAAIARLDSNVFGWEQAKMVAALPRIAGASQTPYALDWFYGRRPTETMTTAQEIFIAQVADRSASDGRGLLVQLVLDPRFETIPGPALKALISRINAWLPTPLVERPYGSLSGDEEKILTEWRKAVRDSVPGWR